MISSTLSPQERLEALSEGRTKLVRWLLDKKSRQARSIGRYPRSESDGRSRLPAARAQQRLWFIDQLEGGSAAYHVPLGLELRGELDAGILQAALDAVVRRHESLRTVFVKVEGEVVQEIVAQALFSLERVDVRGLGGEEQHSEVLRQSREELAAPFDLSVGPLIRGRLLRLSSERHVLLITMHHIVSDGWSIGVLLRELSALYEAFRAGRADPLPPPPIQYADYAQWQRQWMAGPQLQEQLRYWKEHLQGAPELLELPTDRPRPATQSYRGASVRVALGPELTAQLKALARQLNLTMAMTLYAGWSVVLSRLSGQEDIVVGMPVANRQRTELEGLIGFFVNTLAVRVRLEDDPAVGDLLQRVKEIMLEAYAHQDVPFEQVVEVLQPARSLSHSPIFQAMFVLQNAPRDVLQLSGLSLLEQEVPIQTAHFDLTLSLQESAEGIIGTLNYASDLFEEATIERWVRCYMTVLGGMARQPQQQISRLALMSEDERRQVVELFNATQAAYPQDRLIHQLFEEQVRRTPDALAVVYEDQSLTYAQLNAKANQLARQLRQQGVGPDRLVAVCVERGMEMLVALLAILKAGGAYVPLDPVHPRDRLTRMLRDSGAVALLVEPQLSEQIQAPHECARLVIEQHNWEQCAFDRESQCNPVASEVGLTASNLAYVIYTSGSTGTPKGVMVEHRNILNFLEGLEQRIYALQPDCRRVAWNSSFGFDMAAKAWGQLLKGRTVYLVPESIRLSGEGLLTFLERCDIESIECTPSHLRMMRESGFLHGRAPSMRKVLLGGEAIDAMTWRELAGSTGPAFFNMYGPTECSVDASCGRVSGTVPHVGRVMPNARIYVLDVHRQPVPVGVIGEIYIGGAGVARGYLNRPELTAEKFLHDPFSVDPHGRMYKTGDKGRWRTDGTIEYAGRNDHQVKVRGYRIELGEIEAQLVRDGRVAQAAVIVREDIPGERRLVAYVVPANPDNVPTADMLRDSLKAVLPHYMVPSAIVALERLPLTPNGKLHRRALPVPDQAAVASRLYEPPCSEPEQILAEIWQGLLRVDRVGRRDNFFELGGHSLLIVQMMDRLRCRGLSAEVRSVFESPTLADLAASLVANADVHFVAPPNLIPTPCDKIAPEMLPLVMLEPEHIERIVRAVPGGAANVQDIYPLAPLQDGILFHHLLSEQGSDPYVVSTLLLVQSRERLDELIAALQAVIDRHDALRTAVLWEGLPDAVQVVYRRAALAVDESMLHEDRDPLDQVKDWMDPSRQRLDLRRPPLMRLKIAANPRSDEWYALLQLHHIVADATSGKIISAEVATLLGDSAESLPEATPYRNHVAQVLTHARSHDAEAFFSERLGQIDQPTAPFGLLDVHGDGSQIEETSEAVEVGLARRIRNQTRALGVSAATLFHAACALVVARTSGRNDVVFGTVLLGRLHSSAGAQRILGMFINTLPLRLQLRDMSVKELVEHTQRELVALLSHEQASLAVAQRCSGIHGAAPLFSALFNYRHGVQTPQSTWADVKGLRPLASRNGTNYPITLSVDDRESGFSLTAQTDRRADSRRMIGYLRTALESLVEALERAPHRAVLALPILSAEERVQLLQSFNATQVGYPHRNLVHRLFEEQAARTPAATALAYEGSTLSYADLNRRANQLARRMRAQGVHAGELVGIFVERGMDMVLGVVATLKAGAAYVPLDPNYPAERLTHMVQDAAPKLILTQERLRASLPRIPAKIVVLDKTSWTGEETNSANLSVAEVGSLEPRLVYVIYTSGSTGRPKGTAMGHRAMVNLLEWHRATFASDVQPRALQFAALSFDVAFQEIFSTLCTGGTLVLLDEWVRRDPRALTELLTAQAIERLFLPPMMLQSLAEYFRSTNLAPAHLKDVIVAGEQLRISREIVDLFARLEGCRLHNHYGPTETHVVTALTLDGRPQHWPSVPTIGRPIANTQIYILDSQHQPVPLGAVGEIYIAGANLADGYLNNPALTAERFCRDPFAEDSDSRMYRTGDLGRWRVDGTIDYLGRNDDQVKIRGFRIELGEIEAQLALHEEVREAAVVAREDARGEKSLVAYVTPRGERQPRAQTLRAHLKGLVPDHMLPSAYVVLEEFPLTPSGKLNRRALPQPDSASYVRQQYEAPQGRIEQSLAEIWQDLLRLERVGRDDNFFEIGGQSLLVLKLLFAVNQQLGSSLRVTDVYKSPTIRELAVRVAGGAILDDFIDLSQEAALDDSVVVSASLRDEAGNSVLLTGATGFVGRFLLVQLLENTEATVHCLVRAQSQEEASSRLRNTLSWWDLWRDEFQSRLVAVASDMRLPRFGIDDATYRMLAESIDSIYHCATSMNHLETYGMARPVNVDGSKELLRFATHRRLKVINYISTLGVFGSMPDGPRVVNEGTTIDHERHRSSRGYVGSKWVSEKIFMNAADRGVPCNIFRLGLVWADTQQGRYDELQRGYRIIKSCLLSGYGIRDYRFEMAPTPVDYATRAVVLLAQRHHRGRGIFHVASQRQAIEDVFGECNEIAGISLELLPFFDWINEIKALHRDGRSLPVVPLIEYAFSMDEASFQERQRVLRDAATHFDCTRTQHELERAGIVAPVLNKQLLKVCVETMLSKDADLRDFSAAAGTLEPSTLYAASRRTTRNHDLRHRA